MSSMETIAKNNPQLEFITNELKKLQEELDSINDTIVTLNKALVKLDNKNNELQSESKFTESKFQSRINELDNDNKKLLVILAANHLMLGNMKSSLDQKNNDLDLAKNNILELQEMITAFDASKTLMNQKNA